MDPNARIAVVTGANRGIGLEICRQLAQRGIVVVLTSRDEAEGEVARQQLATNGLEVINHQLDVTDKASIQRLADWLRREFGKLDILVNNAGIALDNRGILKVDLETIQTTIETNTYGPLLLCQTLVPLMKRHNYGRIINVSSGMGQLSEMGRETSAYRLSKTALNAVTRMVAAELEGTDILVNSMCPGWVRTDMGGPNADRSVEKGAETAVWLATLPTGGPSGRFFRDQQEIPW
jgi:NAD(P)-dependent dehydrogenase (short-subunit alcohol dehydrogenase family)